MRVGMARTHMEVMFARAGGAYVTRATAPLLGVYSFRECPFFKVDVEFQPVRKPERDISGSIWTSEDPKDVITKISNPYLEQAYYDLGLTQLTVWVQNVHTLLDERAQSFRCGLHPVLDRCPQGSAATPPKRASLVKPFACISGSRALR